MSPLESFIELDADEGLGVLSDEWEDGRTTYAPALLVAELLPGGFLEPDTSTLRPVPLTAERFWNVDEALQWLIDYQADLAYALVAPESAWQPVRFLPD